MNANATLDRDAGSRDPPRHDGDLVPTPDDVCGKADA
jgi:hypothetical protein